MNKKVLILVDRIGPSSKLLSEFVGKNLAKNAEVVLAEFSDLYFSISDKNIYVEIKGISITDFDFVYFRRVGREFSIIASTLATCLKEKNIKFMDTSWAEIGPRGSKFLALVKLCVEKLPIIKSIYVRGERVDANKKRIIKELGFPLVAKELSIQRGVGVYKIAKVGDFAKLPINNSYGSTCQYLFQEYKNLSDEYRLLVLGKKVKLWGAKFLTDKKEFRHNFCLGGRHEYLDMKDLPADLEKISVDAAIKLNLQVAGVDVGVDRKTGKYHLLEVNRGPGFTNDAEFSPEFSELVKYIDNELQK